MAIVKFYAYPGTRGRGWLRWELWIYRGGGRARPGGVKYGRLLAEVKAPRG